MLWTYTRDRECFLLDARRMGGVSPEHVCDVLEEGLMYIKNMAFANVSFTIPSLWSDDSTWSRCRTRH